MTLAAEETGVLGLRRGADRDVDRLFRRYGDDVRRQVRVLIRNRSDVEDIVQQTFLKALAALHRGQHPRQPRQWLLAIARNECLMHYRTESRRPALVELDDALDAAVERDGSRAGELREALSQLRPAQRDALVLRELEGRSYAEIAAAMGLSVAAVETLLFRARRALREQLETAGGCAEASALLAFDTLTSAQRSFLRAHVRGCADCATLERRRRGRISALSRIAGVVPVPQWLSPLFGGAGVKAVAAVAVAAVAAGGTAEIVRSDPHATHRPGPAPPLVHRDPVRHALGSAPVRPQAAIAAAAPVAAAHADGSVWTAPPRAPSARPAPRARPDAGIGPFPEPVAEHPRGARPTTASAKPASSTPSTTAGAPSAAPAAPPPSPLPSSPPPSALPPVPGVTVPPVATPTATTPVVTAPAVTTPGVAVPAPQLTVPAVTTPVATTPTATTPTLTVP